MHYPTRRYVSFQALIVPLTLTALLAGCGSGVAVSDDPSFEVLSSPSATETSGSPSSSVESAGSETSISTSATATSTSSSAKLSSQESESTSVSRADDGSYRLTSDPLGEGPGRKVALSLRDLSEAGLSKLEIEIGEDGQNAFLQYPIEASDVRFKWAGYDLNGEKIYASGSCDNLLQVLTKDDLDVTNFKYVGESHARENCGGNTNLRIDEPGELTLSFEFRQKGFEPVVIRQPILGVN